MSWLREPSDPGNNWFHGLNPNNPQEPGEFVGGPGFLELPTYNMIEKTLGFRVRGGQSLTIIIYRNEQQIWTIQHNQGDNNRYNIKNVPDFGQYRVRLIDTSQREAGASVTVTQPYGS